MENQSPSGSSMSSTAYPRWVMLEQCMEIKVEDSSFSQTDDAKTQAAARTSTGHLIQVSLRLAEPPALSRVFLRIPDGVKDDKSKVLAAHGDSVLIQVCIEEKHQRYTTDHFVYNAGSPAVDPPRPPSLLLLPTCYEQRYTHFPESEMVPLQLGANSTGLLRRGEDELVVAQLMAVSFLGDTPRLVNIQLYMFRSGDWKWNCYDIKIRDDWDVLWDTVLPIGGRQLCWVDLCHGVMIVDVFEESPNVRYVRLPVDPCKCLNTSNRNVYVTAGGGTLKFVNIIGCWFCERSRRAYTMDAWTMRVVGGDMEWVKDGMVDVTEPPAAQC